VVTPGLPEPPNQRIVRNLRIVAAVLQIVLGVGTVVFFSWLLAGFMGWWK